MTWKKTFRTVNSAVKRYQREAQRENKAHLREAKTQERMLLAMQVGQERRESLYSSQNEVEAFETYVTELVSLHKIKVSKINWNELKNARPPVSPVMTYLCKDVAIEKYRTFKPSFFQKLFNSTPKIKATLKQDIRQAEKEDEDNYQQAVDNYQQELKEWELNLSITTRILENDEGAFREIMNKVGAFAAYSFKNTLKLMTDKGVELSIYINGQKAIPTEVKTLLKRGDVSIKPMPKTKYYELYQDHVCSIAIRSAKEVFAFLPVNKVIVTVFDVLLDQSTGHLDNQPILSVLILEETINKLNLNTIDPSEALKNFSHRMAFKKTSGFLPVDTLEYDA